MTETALEAQVRSLIRDGGRITFARFMEMALYDPDGGYYTRPGRVGESGDFYTSPSIHPAFGALICVQLREMWERIGSPGEFALVEMGAGSGLLTEDIEQYARELGGAFAGALRSYPVDRGAENAAEVPSGVAGCVISNELLDAMPVHRFTVEGGELQELWVVERDGELVEEAGGLSDAAIGKRLSESLAKMDDGYVGEVCLVLGDWADEVGRILEKGFVLTVDYGKRRAHLYSEKRGVGTLRCYYRHTLNMNPFQHIGEQDLSIHVDFDAVDEALGSEGFILAGMASQATFLERVGMDREVRGFDEMPSREARANTVALQELMNGRGLGGFNVAIHSKGVSGEGLAGLSAGGEVAIPPLPALDDDPRRVRLLGGGYPQAVEFEGTWEQLLFGEGPPERR